MEQKPKIVKINLDNDIRRIALTATNFESLQKQVAELFSLEIGSFSIKYKDDEGDLITLASNDEFSEALNCCQNNILRFSVIMNQNGGRRGWGGRGGRCGGWRRRFGGQNPTEGHQQIPPQCRPQFGHGPVAGMFPFIQQLAGGFIQDGRFDGLLNNILQSDLCKVVHDHVCDGCDTQISGTRYHCANCEDFDFCSSCYNSKKATHNETHQFEEISPANALKDALKNNNITIDAFLAPGNANEPVAKKVHHAFCDRCDEKIVGIRWKCFECEDFDFCNACYLEANGKEDVKKHSKDHQFGKIDLPEQIFTFGSLKQEYQNKKAENKRNELLAQIEEQKKQEEAKLAELERKKKEIEQQLEEEKKRQQEKIVNKPVVLDSLAPLREQISKEKEEVVVKPQEPAKVVYPFEQKLEALSSMGFVDRERNIKLLIQHRGELLPCIQALLE